MFFKTNLLYIIVSCVHLVTDTVTDRVTDTAYEGRANSGRQSAETGQLLEIAIT